MLFLDRDGVINRMVRYEYGFDSPQSPGDVLLVSGIVELIKWVNTKGIKVIEVTNQPSVAKGKMSIETSSEIENEIDVLLNKDGAYIDKKYICYHHPKGVVAGLSIDCDCRKPKPGLLIQAAKEFDIDLSKSVFLGDKSTDVNCGKMAGCKTMILLHSEDEPEKIEAARTAGADYKVGSHNESIEYLKSFFNSK